MNSEVLDNRLKTFFQKHLAAHKEYHYSLKGLRLCGSQVNPQANSVNLMRDRENTNSVKFTNVITCKSAWACPSCTAKVMAMKGTDIAAAIDALATWYKQDCFMITFTMPHTQKMSCYDSFRLLRETWRLFAHNGNRRGGFYTCGGVRVKATRRIRGQDPYGKFRQELSITHNVRVYEFTWGEEFSWHPHLHVLFWVPHENFNKVLSYEDSLVERWWHCLKSTATKLLKERYMTAIELSGEKPNEEVVDLTVKNIIDEYYTDWRKYPVTGHKSAYMSKTKDGKLKKTTSSMYISGWGGDSETSAEKVKVPQEGHYTPYQIISNALTDISNRDKWLNLYTEYALATRGHRRVEFSSRSGIGKIIKKWKATAEQQLILKKSLMDKAKDWELVYSFSKYQWKQICAENIFGENYLTAEILELARERDGPAEHIENLLNSHEIRKYEPKLIRA